MIKQTKKTSFLKGKKYICNLLVLASMLSLFSFNLIDGNNENVLYNCADIGETITQEYNDNNIIENHYFTSSIFKSEKEYARCGGCQYLKDISNTPTPIV